MKSLVVIDLKVIRFACRVGALIPVTLERIIQPIGA